MKYSTVLVAAFASQALARALPGGDVPDSQNPVLLEAAGATDKTSAVSTDSTKKVPVTNDYPTTDKYPTDKYPSTDKYPTDKYPTDTTPKYTAPKYQSDTYSAPEWKDYTQKVYAPQKQNTYDYASSQPDYKHYSPLPPKDSYSPEKSCYDNLKYPVNIQKEQPCQIDWSPKHGGDYTDDDDCEIHLYHTKDYSKPKYVVCQDCGKGSYDKWTPPSDCESSDDSGYMYRFKYVNKKDNSKCTWSAEFPIYGPKYDTSKKDVCPPPAPVPDCPPTPPCPPPPQAAPPVIVSYPPVAQPAPEAPAAPEAAAPAAPAPAVPAPAAEAAAPTYPTTAEAPTQGVANETAPVPAVTAGGAAIRSSVSVIVTVAALVTFLL